MSATIEFDRLVSYFDGDTTSLDKAYAHGIKIVDKLEARFKKLNLKIGDDRSGGFSKEIDREMRAAEADIRRFERTRQQAERAYSRTVESEGRQRTSARNREQKRAANDFLAHMRRVNAAEKKSSFMGGFGGRSALGGALAFGAGAGAVLGISTGLTTALADGRELYVTLEKLVRFTATLDRNFQSSTSIAKFIKDIEALSLEVPQSAENIAKASFTVKSAYQNMTEPELIQFLKKLSIQATASNTTVDQHAERVLAMAKLYKVTASELDAFGAMIATSFGDALASDAAVGEGFNKLLTSARIMKQPLNEVAAAMGAIQSTSSDAEKNTTNLQNVFAKLTDPKYTEGMKKIFGVDVFTAQGNYKGLNQIVNELAKSLEGLNDKQKSEKIGEVFKDLQAREGIMSMIDVLGQYNQRLRDGADADAFAAKQKTMLDSSEARWQLFANRIDQIKRDAGKAVSSPVSESQTSKTTGGGLLLFYNEAARQAKLGFMNLLETLRTGSAKVETEIAQGLGLMDPATATSLFKGIEDFFAEQRRRVNLESDVAKANVLQKQREFYEAIANDPNGSDEMKAAARKNADDLTVALNEMAAAWAEANKQTPAVSNAGAAVGALYVGGIVGAILAGGNDVQAAQAALVQPNTADASTKGMSLGQMFAAGVASGIRSGGGQVGAAVAGIIDWAFSSGKKEAESHSPSERAARELGVPFAEGLAKGLNDPKAKKAIKQSLKQMYDNLVYEAGRIDPAAGRSRESAGRLFGGLLGDESGSYSSQLTSIAEYYAQMFLIENEAYNKRLANIERQEALIRQRKDLKPEEKHTMLRDLGDKKTDLIGDTEQTMFDLGQDRSKAISGVSLRAIEQAQRSLARTFIETENAMIGVRRSSEQEAKSAYDNEISRIDDRIRRMTVERDKWAADSVQYVEWNNRIADAEADRADAVVTGAGNIKRARQSDKDALEDYKLAVADFARQTIDMQIGADEARLEAMRASGATQEAIFAEEMALAARREAVRHDQFVKDLERQKASLIAADTTGTMLNQITASFNAQMEAEAARHNSVLQQLSAEQGQNSIMGNWQRLMNELPGYKQQFKEFASSLPTMIGDMFTQGLANADGTWKGFLKSMYQSFLQTIQQMLQELFRTQLIKLLIGLGTSLFGGSIQGVSGAGNGVGGIMGGGSGGGYMFAEGGIPPVGQVSLVGERGPELFVPKMNGRILSNDETRDALSGRGRSGDTYNNTVIQNIKAGPRGLVAPRSQRQMADGAVSGLQNASRRG